LPPANDYGLGKPTPLPVDNDDLTHVLAEVDRLQALISSGVAENERLIGEIEDAEAGLEAAAGEIVSLKDLLAKAQEDGGFAVVERDELNAKLEAMAADLAAVRADLDAATAPKPAAKAGK
ncbi:MAG: hypothetical protein Q7T55_09500, partial [Solirubrobacteraceae bacterium]|nr:hypothetical protein [Solirubrobacteraceae bacterium]